jgi:DNA-binding CsgD family transcriptional regulator
LAHGLTRREGEVAQLALQGKTNKRVARDLRISEHTVEDHLKAIFAKVGVSSRGELTARIFAEHYTH